MALSITGGKTQLDAGELRTAFSAGNLPRRASAEDLG
jgi:hypothetical protein